MLRVSKSFLSNALDANGVPFSDEVSGFLGRVSAARGYRSATWLDEASAILRGQSPNQSELPTEVVTQSGERLSVFNLEQLGSTAGNQRAFPQNVNGRAFTEKFGARLSNFSAERGFLSNYWGTAEYLADVFGAQLLPNAVGVYREYSNSSGVFVNDTFYNMDETTRPHAATELTVARGFISLPRQRPIGGESIRHLHSHLVRHNIGNQSPFWGTSTAFSRMGGILHPSAIGCSMSFPTFRVVYNASQLSNAEEFHNMLVKRGPAGG